MSGDLNAQQELREEARVFARYLFGCDLPSELEERYVRASELLFEQTTYRQDQAMLAFVRLRPWSVSFLDGASGLLRPDGLLRRKMLLLAALAETSPEFALEFLPRQRPTLALLGNLVGLGLIGVVRALLGIALYPIACKLRP